MHKGVILLLKATDREDAISQVDSFMVEYQDQVWDWWVYGGRWNGTLAPVEQSKLWKTFAENLLNTGGRGFISQADVDNHQAELQGEWERLGLEGQNPYCNHYDLPKTGGNYDIVPLVDCIQTVKEWWQDPYEAGQKEEEEAKKWRLRKRDGGKLRDDMTDEQIKKDTMYGYILGCAAKLYHQDFSFECNVYNIEENDFSIPEELSGWYAVMIDMHD